MLSKFEVENFSNLPNFPMFSTVYMVLYIYGIQKFTYKNIFIIIIKELMQYEIMMFCMTLCTARII